MTETVLEYSVILMWLPVSGDLASADLSRICGSVKLPNFVDSDLRIRDWDMRICEFADLSRICGGYDDCFK